MRRILLLALAALLPTIARADNLIVNPGFESGLTGWAAGAQFIEHTFNPHSGSRHAASGSATEYDSLQQSVATVRGASYQLSFWLANVGGAPSDFNVYWNGTLLQGWPNQGAMGYTRYQYTVTGTGSDTLLFTGTIVPGTWCLDDVALEGAVPAARKLLVWGNNDYGQLGLGDTTNRTRPTEVMLSGVTDLWTGGYHSIARSSDGRLWAWGFNGSGGLGLGDTTNRSAPTEITYFATNDLVVTDVWAGGSHTIARTSNGKLWAWGRNYEGQLGLGYFTTSSPYAVSTPAEITFFRNNSLTVAAVWACEHHTLARTTDGRIWAWGHNAYGQLGLGDTDNRNTPTAIGFFTGLTVSDLWAGGGFAFARTSDGTLWAWGDNYYGQLGVGYFTRSPRGVPSPLEVTLPLGMTVADLHCGPYHSVGLMNDGSVWAWGYNGQGQLGLGYATDPPDSCIPTPTAVSFFDGKTVAWGSPPGYHAFMATSDNQVWAWGNNGSGQLGLGDTTHRSAPTELALRNIGSLRSAYEHSLALASYNTGPKLWAWGRNLERQLGVGDAVSRSAPTQVAMAGVASIVAGGLHTQAVTTDGYLWAWGNNYYGELGLGDTTDRSTPTRVAFFAGGAVSTIKAGYAHTCAVTADGKVWAWGRNDHGELGLGDTTNRSTPTEVTFFSDKTVATLAVRDSHTLALTSDGRLWAWGYNGQGQLGLGDTVDRSTPTQVTFFAGQTISDWAAGSHHTAAVTSDGKLWAWGSNWWGHLGLGDTASRTTPTEVTFFSGRTITALIAGGVHTMATTSDGKLWSWGYNATGALGLGDTTNRSTPTDVVLPDVRTVVAGVEHTLAITSDNTIPVADPQTVSATSGIAKPIILTGSDGDGDPLTFSIVTDPANGNVTGTPPNVVYTSAPTFHGTDTFTFKANDGYDDSAPATVTVNVDAPVPVALNLSPSSAGPGSDVELAVRGQGFCSDSVVRWNGTDLTRVSVTAKLIRATIPAALLATPGGATVTVYTPGPGGGESNGLIFRIGQPAIKVDALTVTKNGLLSARITLKNTGSGIAQNVRITLAKMQKLPGGPVVATSTTLPVVVGNLNPGATIVVTPDLQWPGTVANVGDTVLVQLGGTFTGGAFNSSRKATVVGGKAGRK